jgi:hypothetical protein
MPPPCAKYSISSKIVNFQIAVCRSSLHAWLHAAAMSFASTWRLRLLLFHLEGEILELSLALDAQHCGVAWF